MNGGNIDEYNVPPSRLEFPPACKFAWGFETVVQKLSQEELIDADLFQGVSEKDKIKGRGQAVPIYDQNPHTALLQSTGLTSQALYKHSDTWTVKAIIKRALGRCNAEEAGQQAQQPEEPVAPVVGGKHEKKRPRKAESADSLTEEPPGAESGTENLTSSVVHVEPAEEGQRARSVDRVQLTREILTAFAPQTAKTDAPSRRSFRRTGMKGVQPQPVEDIDDYL